MMKWATIGTWKMAEEGIDLAAKALSEHKTSKEATLIGVQNVEDNPDFHSVGYGGLPDREGHVCMDGGYMDGDTLHFGAVASLEGFWSVAEVAQSLAQGDANNLLVGEGAWKYAKTKGFRERNNLTPEALQRYQEKVTDQLKAYDGHDTVCFLAKDENGTLCATTSTSGLFMKEPGRVGDTALPGVGFYADSEVGAAAATGMGEEISKGALSYAVITNLRAGMNIKDAAYRAVADLDASLIKRNGYAQPMSLIAIDKYGSWGIGTNCEFTFVTADENHETTVWISHPIPGGLDIQKWKKSK